MAKEPAPEIVSMSAGQLEELLTQLRDQLNEANYTLVERMLKTLVWLMALVEKKDTTIGRLNRLIFGPRTEKSAQVLDKPAAESNLAATKPKPKAPGHGRNGIEQYPGARRIPVPHPKLYPADLCPDCEKGSLYLVKPPSVIMRIKAQPIIAADIYELETLRCGLCHKVFTAPAPPEAGTEKYDPQVGLMLGLLRFGAGLPHYRLDKWQKDFGVPLPASTQWELMDKTVPFLEPVYEKLIDEASVAQRIYTDDTKMRIQSLRKEIQESTDKNGRKGIFTTGIIAETDGRRIALFLTGRNHAGENLDKLLDRRPEGLDPPVHMCDALACNISKEFKTILSHCATHARRNFVDLANDFPKECEFVLEKLGTVYYHDEQCKKNQLTPEQRLLFHQEYSGPIMDQLKTWMHQQIDGKQVEPNSGLGQAIEYMLSRWESFTLFLRLTGAPLDNNIVEQSLKMAILHRKNSLSFKTQHGAKVGDIFMSLIHTCRLALVNVFDYFTTLQKNADKVVESPKMWLPWNYRTACPQ